MDQTERRMIEDLFAKLRQAEQQSPPRDREAEQEISDALRRQPAAPYYMSQVILIQDQAMQAQHERIQKLEQELAQRPAGGGSFLSGLFGGGAAPSDSAAPPVAERPPAPPSTLATTGNRGWSNSPPAAPERVPALPPGNGYGAPQGPGNRSWFGQGQAQGGGSGFLGSAMQTAAGVAGGMLLANAVGGLFGSGAAHAAGLPGGDAAATAAAQAAAAEAQAAAAEAEAAAARAEQNADAGNDDLFPADDGYPQDDLLADNSGDFETFDGF
jgi:hypothetical protein